MILICNDKKELNVIGEISKVNMISENGRSYIRVLTNCENSIKFFKEWSEVYSTEKRSITFFDQFKVLSTFTSVGIENIKNDSFDWYGNFIPLSIEIDLNYVNFGEKISNEKSEYFKIYKSFIRDKKINQIID